MKILVDEHIPFAKEAFSDMGDVTLVPGRRITSLANVDIAIVRSVTRVNK